MKFIKKINIGLALAIIAIVAVVIYSVRVEASRKNSKEDIKKTCEEFIEITDKYCILPEQYQVIGEDGKKIDLNSYYDEMKTKLQEVTTTEQTANIEKSILSGVIEEQLLNTSEIITNFDKNITKISSYAFDGNQVTVTFKSKTTVKRKYQDVNMETGEMSEKVKENTFDTESETITLELKDGKWKVVCANLVYNSNAAPMSYTVGF